MHLLDNPIWNALNTRQENLAEKNELARRFPPQVTTLAAFAEPNDCAYAALARLLQATPGALFLHSRSDFPAEGWQLLRERVLVQMVYENGIRPAVQHDWVALGAADVPEMMALAELTQPGPFGPRTYQLGTYLGVRKEGKLVAMVGERLRVPGFAEISVVCTHPEHAGQGYAGSLMAVLIERMRSQAETPFLHVAGENARAIALYERLGFRRRAEFQLAVLQSEPALADETRT